MYAQDVYQPSTNKKKLDSHLNDCKAKKPTRVTFSDKEKLEFTNTERQIKHAFVIYADFGSTLEKIQTCEANPMSSYTQQVQKHTANSFCVYTKCEQNEYSNLRHMLVQMHQKNSLNTLD